MGNIESSNLYFQLCCRGGFKSLADLELQENLYNANSKEYEPNNRNIEISQLKELTPISKVIETSYKESFELSYLNKLEKAIYYAKILTISIENTDIRHRKLVINPLGCEESFRPNKDGFTFFGSKKKDLTGKVINDIVLPFMSKPFASNYRGSFFQINYDINSDVYFIKDLKLGYGTFYKINKQTPLQNNSVILIGETYIIANIFKCNIDSSEIKLTVHGNQSSTTYRFTSSFHSFNPITIGRHEISDIKIIAPLISKTHSTLTYFPEQGWVLQDGDIPACSKSKNGTWLYINDNTEIFDCMLFKSGHIIFKVSIL